MNKNMKLAALDALLAKAGKASGTAGDAEETGEPAGTPCCKECGTECATCADEETSEPEA
jgi:hypothetical protein